MIRMSIRFPSTPAQDSVGTILDPLLAHRVGE
jgi:hypothetical protein